MSLSLGTRLGIHEVTAKIGEGGMDEMCQARNQREARLVALKIMNQANFLAEQQQYFAESYGEFLSFGGPSVYFHNECLRAGREAFLSERHIEMLYATLTAWGMHRMGNPERTKTKLTDWQCFSGSIRSQGVALQPSRRHRMIDMSDGEYSDALMALKPCYIAFTLSVSGATIVVNSKALFHLFPEFIPPIDRQYTARFFRQAPDRWRNSKGQWTNVPFPADIEGQFKLFHKTCVGIKQLTDRVKPSILEHERQQHGLTPPKALDNAIVNYIRIVDAQRDTSAAEKLNSDLTNSTPNADGPAQRAKSSTLPSFVLTVHRTYFEKGFFNVPVDCERYLGEHRDAIEIDCEYQDTKVDGYITRSANRNKTPRIMGGRALKRWFQETAGINEQVCVEILSPTSLRLARRNDAQELGGTHHDG